MSDLYQRLLRSTAGLLLRLSNFLTRESNAMQLKSIEAAFSRWGALKSEAAPTTAPRNKPVTAAPLSIVASDTCPYCKVKMRLTSAVGVPVFICDADRHVTPAPNDVVLDD